MRYQSKINFFCFNHYFFYLLIIAFSNYTFSESKYKKLFFINNKSIIKIKFTKAGKNKIFSSSYRYRFSAKIYDAKNAVIKPDKTLISITTKNNNFITINFGNAKIDTCEKMFKGLKNILEIDLSNFDSSKVTNMAYMFDGCSNLTKITFGKMDTSLVKNMESLFDGCIKLKSLDVTNFKTSLVTNMKRTFACLHELVSLKLSKNFKTSKVTNMTHMFYHSFVLASIDLSMFDTSQVKDMSNMFSDAKKLKSLVISNFDTSKVITIENMFKNCPSLNYLDIKNFKINNKVNIKGTFQGKNTNMKICLSDSKAINKILGSDKDKLICSNSCINGANIYIDKVNNKCVKNCLGLYLYEIFCYKSCPQSTQLTSSSSNICVDKAPEGYYYDSVNDNYKKCFENCKSCNGAGNKENNNCKECKSGFKYLNDIESKTKNCYEICPFYYYFDESNNYKCTVKCKDNYSKIIPDEKRCIDKCKNDNIYKFESNGTCFENCPEGTIYNEKSELCGIISGDNEELENNDLVITNLKDGILGGSFDNILEKDSSDYIMEIDNITYQITTSDNKKSNQNNISSISLGKCEQILKEKYNINMSMPLIILKIDYPISGQLIPLIGYEVYHPLNKSKLDLSYCNSTVNLNIPVSISEDKIYQYDPNSDFYVDECSSYTSDNGTDIPMYDRKKSFVDNNYSLCEMNCNFEGYEKDSKQSKCSCKIKNQIEYISNISTNSNVLSKAFNISENDLGYTNIFACTKNLFTAEGLIKNYSSYILIASLLFFLMNSMFFIKCGYKSLLYYINIIINNKIKFQKQFNNNNINRFNKFKMNKNINHPPRKIINIQNNMFSLDTNNCNSKLNLNKTKKKSFMFANNNKITKNKNTINNIKKFNSFFMNKASHIPLKKAMNTKGIKTIKRHKDCEMNSFNYFEAVLYDKRTCCQYYKSLLKAKQLLIFAFCPNDDYNSRIIKLCIFILSFNIHYATNFAYFIKQTILHKIFEDGGRYDIIFFIPYICITFAVSHIIIIIIKLIFLSDSNIIEIKKQKKLILAQRITMRIKKKLKIKYAMFFILGIIFHFFLWLALSSFSSMFFNTQLYVLENALLAFSISLIYPFLFNILPCIFRIISLRTKQKNHNIMYNISKFLQVL